MLPPLPSEKEPLLHRLLPVTGWLPGYERGWLTGDVLAGLTVWALLVPEALAYASIAGVPPQYGLYCAPFALLAYAVFGGSRTLMVGPSSTVAIVSASVVAPLAAGAGSGAAGDARYLALTVALAILSGAALVAAGLARLGFVAKFLAKPVLDGFIMGLAFTIAFGQAGKMLGVHASGDTAVDKVVSIVGQAGDWAWLPLVVGGACLALLLLLERVVPRLPAALVVAALATVVSALLHLADHGLDTVGTIPGGLPDWALTGLGLEDLYHLLPGACTVALVGFTESIAIAKEQALRNDYRLDVDREMVANGLANVGSGLFQGFVVDGSLSKTAAGEHAGGHTQMVGIVVAALTFATILFLTGLFTALPEATLAAVVIVALWRYFKPQPLVRLFRVRKADFALSLSALLGVLVFGVLPGVVIGVVLSLALLIQRAGSPNSAVLGRDPGGTDFADMTTHPDFQTIPGLVIYRFDGPLVFPNAERFVDEVRSLVKAGPGLGSPAGDRPTPELAQGPPPPTPVTGLIIDYEAVGDMDTTAADQFAGMVAVLQKQGVHVMLARVHAPVREFMRRDGLLERIEEDGRAGVFARVADAVDAFEKTTGGGRPTR